MLKSESQTVPAPAKRVGWEGRTEVTGEGWKPACAPALRNLGLFQNSPQSTKVPSTQTSRAHHATCPRLLLLCINIRYWPAPLTLFTTHWAASRPWWLSQQPVPSEVSISFAASIIFSRTKCSYISSHQTMCKGTWRSADGGHLFASSQPSSPGRFSWVLGPGGT